MFWLSLSLSFILAYGRECGEFGNFNKDIGECDCLFGFRGRGCAEKYLDACEEHEGSNELTCDISPHNCRCQRSCYAHFCQPPGPCEVPFHNVRWTCWEADGTGAAQNSVFPPSTASGLKYYEDFREGLQKETNYESMARLNDHMRQVPASECKDSCSKHGICWENVKEKKTRCVCRLGWEGAACETPIVRAEFQPCLNNCNQDKGWGRCVNGFCVCSGDRFGRECSRNETFSSGVRVLHKPRIFIYELPTEVVYRGQGLPGSQDYDGIYAAWEAFSRRIYNDWDVRTQNPHEANLFFIPWRMHNYASNLGEVPPHALKVLKYIRDKYPFYNATNGRDHFALLSQDRGGCYMADVPELDSFIRVTHYGFSVQEPPLFPEFPNKRYACHDPFRDVVFAPHLSRFDELYNSTDWGKATRGREGKKYEFFFAGSVRPGKPTYSGGARQAVAEYVKSLDDPKFRIHEGSISSYIDEVRASVFCGSFSGHGWGIRITTYMANGCIPVTVQEHIVQPFDSVIDYSEFSVTVGLKDVPRLREILAAITDEEVSAMQRNVQRYAPAFDWSDNGLAYASTIQAIWKSFQIYQRNVSFPYFKKENRRLRRVR